MATDARTAAESMLEQIDAAARYSLQREQLSRQDRFGYESDTRLRPLHDRLLASGWIVETHTHGSVYYVRDGRRMRLSNHEVPGTAEREHAVENGGWSWHRHGYQIITARQTLAACLAEIEEIEEEWND